MVETPSGFDTPEGSDEAAASHRLMNRRIAVWAAVKNALSYVSPGVPSDLQLPATGEEILRCLTQLGTPPGVPAFSVDGQVESSKASLLR